MTGTNFDIIIIGGGLAGQTQAVLLGQQGKTVACIDRLSLEQQQDPDIDRRTTAISWGSKNLLTHVGIWDMLDPKAQKIEKILIKDEDSPITLDFLAQDVEAEAFGWIVDNHDLRNALLKALQSQKTVTHLTGQTVASLKTSGESATITLHNGDILTAQLLIGADGRGSFTREAFGIGHWEKDYDQTALVCLIEHEKAHDGLALEHFRAQGPFAVLPFTQSQNGHNRSAVVWTVEKDDVARWMACSDAVFNAALQERCGDLYGQIISHSKREAWPLTLKKAYRYTAERAVLIAEAAHGIHPIAGQGLNMSMRDIAMLTELLDGQDNCGNAAILKRYQVARMGDNLGMAVATDVLNSLFGFEVSGIRALRRFGLHAVSRIPFAKKFFMRQAMGATGNMPVMIRRAA
jgi:2-octaprenyl-6-methoxyphenol hydroxylase